MPNGTTITGLDEVQAYLRDLPREVVRKHLPKALRAAGGVMGSAVLARTPGRTERKGGDADYPPLRDCLEVDVRVNETAGAGRADIGFGKQQYVADLIEYGHEQVSHDGTPAGFTPAHPFIRPAFDAAAEVAIEAFDKALSEGIDVE